MRACRRRCGVPHGMAAPNDTRLRRAVCRHSHRVPQRQVRLSPSGQVHTTAHRWWVFTSVEYSMRLFYAGGGRLRGAGVRESELECESAADDLLGEWTEHPMSPIRRSDRGWGRNGGRPVSYQVGTAAGAMLPTRATSDTRANAHAGQRVPLCARLPRVLRREGARHGDHGAHAHRVQRA